MYGLKGNIRKMVTEMQQVRNPGPTASPRTSRCASTWRRIINRNGEPLSPNHLFAELGIDENYTTVNQL
jgi:hypothetical protein